MNDVTSALKNVDDSAAHSETSNFEPGSFRDRTARVVSKQGRIYRLLSKQGAADWQALVKKSFFQALLSEMKVVGTEEVSLSTVAGADIAQNWTAALQHERVPFVSYPYEWSFSMLKDSALLQLEILERALNENFTLKDASAFNVQFFGARPAFIDTSSFEPLAAGEPWVGYKQFCEMYLFPLFMESYKGTSFRAWVRGDIEGIGVDAFAQLMSFRDLFRPGVFKHVYLQSKLQKGLANTKQSLKSDLSKAGFNKELILINVRNLRKIISSLRLPNQRSTWSDYAQDNSYDEQNAKLKQEFVRKWSSSKRNNLVWDLGCNTGTFSKIAAESAEYVISMDGDLLAIERLYLELKQSGNEKILPLTMPLANPSSNLGWRGKERQGLAERGKPSLVLCLALVHHMVISANIPLSEFVDWLRSLGSDLIIEFITKDDSMVKQLLRNKKDLYDDYDQASFESYLQRSFNVVEKKALPNGTRTLYFAESKGLTA